MQIRKTLELFRSRHATIRLGLTPDDAAYELSKVTKTATKFSEIAEQLAKDNKVPTEDKMIKTAIEDGKFEILCSNLSQDFCDKYKLQIRSHETFSDLFSFLESTFQSTLTKEEKIRSARKNLAEVTRFSDDNETFTNFLQRVETLGKPLKTTDSTELFDLFTQEAFLRNLTPHHKACLNDHNQTSKKPAEKAKFLDDRKKHLKTVNVSQIETTEYSELKAQIAALAALVQSTLLNPSAADVADNARVEKAEIREINKLSTQPAKPMLNRDSTTRIQGNQTRCQQCGLFGHTKDRCRRTLKAICHKCGKQGHLQAVCRMSKNLH